MATRAAKLTYGTRTPCAGALACSFIAHTEALSSTTYAPAGKLYTVEQEETMELTQENVEKVLDEVCVVQ